MIDNVIAHDDQRHWNRDGHQLVTHVEAEVLSQAPDWVDAVPLRQPGVKGDFADGPIDGVLHDPNHDHRDHERRQHQQIDRAESRPLAEHAANHARPIRQDEIGHEHARHHELQNHAVIMMIVLSIVRVGGILRQRLERPV